MTDVRNRNRFKCNKKRVVVLVVMAALVIGAVYFIIKKDTEKNKLVGRWELLASNYMNIYLGSEISDGEYLDFKAEGKIDCKIDKEIKDANWEYKDGKVKIENDKTSLTLTYEDKVLTYEGKDFQLFFIKKSSTSPKIEEIKEHITENIKDQGKKKAKKKIIDEYTSENIDDIYGKWQMFAEEYVDTDKKPLIIEKQKEQKSYLSFEKDGTLLLVNDDKKVEGKWMLNEELNIIDVDIEGRKSLILTLDKVMVLVAEDRNSYFVKPGEKNEKQKEIIKMIQNNRKE